MAHCCGRRPTRTPICSGRCAGAAAISASSRRSSTACSRWAPRSLAGRLPGAPKTPRKCLISIASSPPRRRAKPPALPCCASRRPRPGYPRTSMASRSSPSLSATAAASKRVRPSLPRCANWGNLWLTSSRAGPTPRCRACSTPPSPRGGATTGSRTTWRASRPRPSTC